MRTGSKVNMATKKELTTPQFLSRLKSSNLQEFRSLIKELGLTDEYTKCCACEWKKAAVDLAHVKSFKDGGLAELKNIVPLCPNHHRCLDYGVLDENSHRKINKFIEKILFLSEPI